MVDKSENVHVGAAYHRDKRTARNIQGAYCYRRGEGIIKGKLGQLDKLKWWKAGKDY